MNASYRPSGTLAVESALQPYRGPWNARLAAHLQRRAGFGGTPGDVRRIAALPLHDAVDSFIAFPNSHAAGVEAPELPDFGAYVALLRAQRASPSAEVRMQLRQLRRRGAVALQMWWLKRMLATPAPLQEKMTLFWHGHFATAYGTKGISPQDALTQNALFRSYALGNAHALTLAVSKDPAMLKYLDNARNVKAHPNENYARELMELFTLGIGNYTEADVRESARAFTGWTVRGYPSVFAFAAERHDDGNKTFMGRSGPLDGADIIEAIFSQPAAARFLAAKLLAFFVYNDPEPQLVEAVAALLRANAFEIRPVMSTLLRSNVFFSERAYRALVKSPIELVVGSYRLFGLTEMDNSVLGALARMGQIVFYPPSVKGWDGGSAWLSSQTMLTRENFASALVQMPQMTDPSNWLASLSALNPRELAGRLIATVLQDDASPASLAKVQAYVSGDGTSALGALNLENFQERVRGAAYLTMAMPAYQLN